MDILWWHWIVLGLVLVVAELLTAGGFYIIFFGIAAVIVGVLAGFNMAGPIWMQLLMFSVISIGTLVLFRGRMLKAVQHDLQAPPVDALVGEVGIATEDFAGSEVGKVEFRGASWSARTAGAHAINRGARVRVTRVDGLMLFVEPEGIY